MKNLILCILIACSFTLLGQQRKINVEVGKYIQISACKTKDKNFKGIDVYARTTAYDRNKVDSLSGEGLIAAFFSKDASIDAKRLPCSMGGKKYKIAALQEYETENGLKKVVVCYTNYSLTLIWIDLDEANKHKEIKWF
jgi:hypothetical protein